MVGLAVLVAAVLAGDPLAALEIRGETSCPQPEDVRAQLQPLAPSAWPAEAAIKSVVLAEAGDRQTGRASLVVTLFGKSHEMLEERRLLLYPTCDERARAVAVVLASWLTALPSGAPLAMQLTKAAPPPAPAVVLVAPVPASAAPAIAVNASAAALASVATDGVAPGVMVEATLAPSDARWSGSLAGLLEGTHSKSVGGGQATWWRWGGVAGGAWKVVRGRVWLDVRAAFLFTRLHIAGTGFPSNTAGTTWDLSAALGTRLGYAGSRLQPWLGAWAVGWGGAQNVHLVGSDTPRDALPRFEALFGLGATFGASPATF